jgi:hypothetical protein
VILSVWSELLLVGIDSITGGFKPFFFTSFSRKKMRLVYLGFGTQGKIDDEKS